MTRPKCVSNVSTYTVHWYWYRYQYNLSKPLLMKDSFLRYVTPYEGKAVPLQACSGPKGSRKLRFPDFMTTAQDGGKVDSLTHRPPLPPRNTPATHFC